MEVTKEVLMKIHPCLAQLRAHLESARYARKVADRYLAVTNYFVHFLDKNHVPIESAQPVSSII